MRGWKKLRKPRVLDGVDMPEISRPMAKIMPQDKVRCLCLREAWDHVRQHCKRVLHPITAMPKSIAVTWDGHVGV